MRKTIPVVLVALCLAAAAVAKYDKPKLPRWKKGEQTGTVEIDGKPESFTALVPRGYTTKKRWPVVLLAHGNGLSIWPAGYATMPQGKTSSSSWSRSTVMRLILLTALPKGPS